MPLSNPKVSLILVNTEVFSGNSPGVAAFTDLDLSGVVGANPAKVKLRVWSAGNGAITFRPNGETEYAGNNEATSPGSSYVNAGTFSIMEVLTNNLGIVEWYKIATGIAVTIDVIGFVL